MVFTSKQKFLFISQNLQAIIRTIILNTHFAICRLMVDVVRKLNVNCEVESLSESTNTYHSLARTRHWLDVCHPWFHLHCQAVWHTKQARITKWKKMCPQRYSISVLPIYRLSFICKLYAHILQCIKTNQSIVWNLINFNSHLIKCFDLKVPTFSYNEYIDKIQHGTCRLECTLSRITLFSRLDIIYNGQ